MRRHVIDLTGTVAIVTGGTRGLGRAMTLAILEAGGSVAVMARHQERLDQLSRETDGAVVTLAGDVSEEEDLEMLVVRTLEVFGHVDVVVSNAALTVTDLREDWSDNPLPFWEVEPRQYRDTLTVNAFAPFVLARRTAPLMMKQGWGRLIYVSTNLGTMIRLGQAGYGPSKSASEALYTIIARDLEGTGVTSNVLLPGGPSDTDAIPVGLRSLGSKLVRPEAMGPPIVWLASRESDGVTAMRFKANLWDAGLSPAEAAAIAGSPAAWPTL